MGFLWLELRSNIRWVEEDPKEPWDIDEGEMEAVAERLATLRARSSPGEDSDDEVDGGSSAPSPRKRRALKPARAPSRVRTPKQG